MAFAPVLERKVESEEKGYTKELFRNASMTAEEKHNSKISYNYAKLINPEFSLNDIIERKAVSNYEEEAVEPAQENEVAAERVYLVENARADSELFRADSIINRTAQADKEVLKSLLEDEENEDLRPTATTIQYQTAGVKKSADEGKITLKSETKKIGFTKKDKIIIAVAITVIVALFVLIIVNSAIITGLNGEVSALQNNLAQAERVYTEALLEKEAYLEESNIWQVVSDFAAKHGMSLK